MKLIGLTLAAVISLGNINIAQAKRPFSFEGIWVSGRMAGEFRRDITIKNCHKNTCDFHFQQGKGLDFCEFSGQLKQLNKNSGQIFLEAPLISRSYCIIDINQKGDTSIQVRGQNCSTLCPQGAMVDGAYKNQNIKGYYETGYDCYNERNTYAEAAICSNRLLSLGHREAQKLQAEAKFNKELIKEWEKGRNFCQTETQCLKQKYHDFIEALSQKISGKDFNLQAYYQQTQGRYGSPFESFLTFEKMQNSISEQGLEEYESLMGERIDRSDKENIFLTYIPQNKRNEERAVFYLKDNEMWIGYIGKGASGYEEIFLYAPKEKSIMDTPKAIQNWEKDFQNINCRGESYCPQDLYPTINFTPSL